MNQAQAGIFKENTHQFYYLEYNIDFSNTATSIKQAIHKAVKDTVKDVNVVVAFGKKAWDFIQPA